MMYEKTKDVAEQLELRARQDVPITPAEYRRLFIKGLAAALRELDSISYFIRHQQKGE